MSSARRSTAQATRSPSRGRYDRTLTPEERLRDQRRRLLDAAALELSSRGYAAATVEGIIERAGMSRRTFYEHFDDVRDVLLTLHDRTASLAFRFVEAAVRAENGPLAQLHAGVTAFLAILAEYADLARVVFREVRAAGPEHEVRREAVLARYVGLIGERVSQAHADGLVRRPPDELTLYALVSGIESVAMRYVSRREEARALEAAPVLVELIVRAFS